MTTFLHFRNLALLIAAVYGATGQAAAELQCSPQNAAIAYPVHDPFFASEKEAWAKVTRSRYLEGIGDSCVDVLMPGYESFPTKHCRYSAVDAGGKAFDALSAQVILLDPSARQLASWSVRACREVGATDKEMGKCLSELRSQIVRSNGAQFPVAGSVVESRCSSSRDYPNGCDGLPDNDKARQPRNTWFRNGVAIDYQPAFGVFWSVDTYPAEVFDKVLDVKKSDKYLNSTFVWARIANALRQDWIDWRNHVGKPLMLPGIAEKTVDDRGWQSISREVQKAACKSDKNELFNAVVFSHRQLWLH